MIFTWVKRLERPSVLFCGYDGILGSRIISGYIKGVGEGEIEVMRDLRVQNPQNSITGPIRD